MIQRFFYTLLAIATLLSGCKRPCQEVCETLPVFIKSNQHGLVLSNGKLQVEITPSIAGRISSVKYDQHELMIPTDYSLYKPWGTTLWPSPQSEWAWPPIKALDAELYKLSVDDDKIILTSVTDAKTGYQFVKTYGLHDDGFEINYRLYNHSTKTKKVAAMEVTRFLPEGELLFPRGKTEPSSGIFYPLVVNDHKTLLWYTFDAKKIRADHHKLMMDASEGWVAYRNQGYVLIKQFDDMPPNAILEGQGEVEIFSHVDRSFLELKIQSAAATLETGKYLEWKVIWHVKKLPEHLISGGSVDALADYVRTIVDN